MYILLPIAADKYFWAHFGIETIWRRYVSAILAKRTQWVEEGVGAVQVLGDACKRSFGCLIAVAFIATPSAASAGN